MADVPNVTRLRGGCSHWWKCFLLRAIDALDHDDRGADAQKGLSLNIRSCGGCSVLYASA